MNKSGRARIYSLTEECCAGQIPARHFLQKSPAPLCSGGTGGLVLSFQIPDGRVILDSGCDELEDCRQVDVELSDHGVFSGGIVGWIGIDEV